MTASSGNGLAEEFTYDTWGRTLTATDGTGNTATTSYDTAGRVATFDDGKGTYTYGYDGEGEHRGLMTRVDLGYAAGDADVVTGDYDAAGNLVAQSLPGGYRMEWSRNLAGQPTSLSYSQAGVPVVGFSQAFDHLGRVRAATGPAGTRTYRYDDRARLASVVETGGAGCVTRQYAFTGDSNRTELETYGPDGDGGCQTTTVASSESYSYDQADRIVDAGYSYDPLGRTLTMPAGHTDQAGVAGAGDLAISYRANDMVATLQQAVPDATGTVVKRQTFTLDASDRISSTVTRTDGVALGETVNHYDGESDSPAWTETKTRPDEQSEFTETWDRYLSDLTGGLAIEVDGQGVAVLQFANLHGDIVATATLGQAGITHYTETDEYGRPQAGATTARYGWLGTHQRDTDTIGGLVLMGARLYAAATGRFLSIDPVPGGNDNRYTYPADPINKLDLSGEFAIALAAVAAILVVGFMMYASTPAYRQNAALAGEAIRRWVRDRWGGIVALHSRATRAAIAGAIGIAYAIKRTKAMKKEAKARQKAESAKGKREYSKRGEEHKKNKKPEKHEKGRERRKRDKGGESGDERRYYRR